MCQPYMALSALSTLAVVSPQGLFECSLGLGSPLSLSLGQSSIGGQIGDPPFSEAMLQRKASGNTYRV